MRCLWRFAPSVIIYRLDCNHTQVPQGVPKVLVYTHTHTHTHTYTYTHSCHVATSMCQCTCIQGNKTGLQGKQTYMQVMGFEGAVLVIYSQPDCTKTEGVKIQTKVHSNRHPLICHAFNFFPGPSPIHTPSSPQILPATLPSLCFSTLLHSF